jgi:hypothetical protein
MAVGEKNLWFALPASAIVTGLWAIQKQRLRSGTEKRACVHEWSRSRFVGNPETEPLQPRPLLSQNILTRHAKLLHPQL